MGSGVIPVSEPDEEFETLLEQSSLGSPAAQRLRRRTPRVQAETVQAVSDFYRAEIRGLVNFLLWIGADLSDAVDVAQEAMIEATQKWSSIRDHRAWIRRVASRRYGQLRSGVGAATEREARDRQPLLRPSGDIAGWEQQHEVLRLVGALPERQRQVLAWTYDAFTPAEIADELRITPDAVRAALRRARRTLEKGMDRQKPR